MLGVFVGCWPYVAPQRLAVLGQVLSVGPVVGDHGGRVSGIKHGPGPGKKSFCASLSKRNLDSSRM